MKKSLAAKIGSAAGKRKVMVFGTFDIFHDGHRYFLRQARKHGGYLLVVVARDVTVVRVKGLAARYSEQERVDVVKKSGLANDVVLGSLDDKFRVLAEFKPDVVCLGYDQKQSVIQLRRKLIDSGLERTMVVKIGSYKPDTCKSSKLRKCF